MIDLVPHTDIETTVRAALAEDVGRGDLTAALIEPAATAAARLIVRESATLCGSAWFDEVFRQIDPSVTIDWRMRDGDDMVADAIVCELGGKARAILTGERTALNFLQTLSGTATATRRIARQLTGSSTKVLDTRKTLPGLRLAQKYAVRCGGGVNYRLGLYDAVLIKENHIASVGGIGAAVARARQTAPRVPLEVEVETLAQLAEALDTDADRIMLDNFSMGDLQRAVALRNAHSGHRKELEASGGIDIDRLRAVAATGVDFVSIGALTKHLHAVDFSMRFL